MKTTFFAVFASMVLAGIAALLAGCVSTVDGRSQAGVPFLKDSVEGRYNRTVPQVFEASKTVLAKDGVLSAENRINNSLEAKVNQNTVFVRVDQVDPNVSSVVVQVRTKAGATDIDMAHQIEKEIALALTQ